MVALALLCSLPGCGPSDSSPTRTPQAGSAPSTATSGEDAPKIPLADLRQKIAEYMPPLEGGALLIAPPKGWDFSRAGSDYLVGFHPANASLNDLPRILVSAEDTPYAGIENLDADNAQDFAQQVASTLSGEELRSRPRVVTLGDRVWVEHVALRKSRNTPAPRQVLQTVVNGRLYKIILEAFDREFSRLRDSAFAVAATAQFPEDVGDENVGDAVAPPDAAGKEAATEQPSPDSASKVAEP